MQRRDFLHYGLAAAGSAAVGSIHREQVRPANTTAVDAPAFSVVPVVGDGKWIWNVPPKDQSGYLEPRPYSLKVGIELESRGYNDFILATTPLPVSCPEQKIDEEQVEATGCEATVRELAPYSRQLLLNVEGTQPGQKISAVVTSKLTNCKQFLNYQRDQFPEKQQLTNDVRQTYLGDSTGIQTRAPQVRALLRELVPSPVHPWEQAERFCNWVRANIRAQLGPYTSVVTALETHRGDCEEMTAVFIALCRASGIPARIVWVPNHNWAEFYLVDGEGQGHWIPAHIACYHWFGWTGAHELVLQKGDRISVPEKGTSYRLVADWMRHQGLKPTVRYWAELEPLPPAENEDPGPGARRKIETGEWKLLSHHQLDKYMRR